MKFPKLSSILLLVVLRFFVKWDGGGGCCLWGVMTRVTVMPLWFTFLVIKVTIAANVLVMWLLFYCRRLFFFLLVSRLIRCMLICQILCFFLLVIFWCLCSVSCDELFYFFRAGWRNNSDDNCEFLLRNSKQKTTYTMYGKWWDRVLFVFFVSCTAD